MDRRSFSRVITSGALGLGIIGAESIANEMPKSTIKPSRLKIGDTIGLIAPAGAISEKGILKAVKNIEELGFKVKEGQFLRSRYGYLAGKDNERLSDIHAMYADASVKGIWCVRGGYGATRLLDLLDYQLIKENAKALIGYSDITALLNAIYQKTGTIGFHGPVGSSNQNSYNQISFKTFLMEPEDSILIENFKKEQNDYDAVEILREGVAEGVIVGGNLSLLAAMVGTKYAPNYRNKIVLIEDVGEEPYRIDRMLTQLIGSTNLAKASGIILGQFKGCNPENPETSLSLLECLKDRLLPLEIPVIYGMHFGHIEHNFTFPIGAKGRISSKDPRLEVLEKTVS